MRIDQEFHIEAPAADVFALLTDPERLPEWQPTTVGVRRDSAGPLTPGERFREVHRALGRDLESTVEVAEYAPPRTFALKILDGPIPLDGRWTLVDAGAGTDVRFVGEGEVRGLKRLAAPALRRQFRGYHRRLKGLLEGR